MIWKKIPGFSNYSASECGHIRSDERYVSVKSGGKKKLPETILKPKVIKGGYFTVSIKNDDGEVKCPTVHSLIMATFEGPRPEGFQILHLDDNPANCAKVNLKYGTSQENHDLKVLHGRTARGESINTTKLTEKQVIEMRDRRAKGETTLLLATEFGISSTAVSKICTGQNWKYAGGPITPNRFPGRRVKNENL